MSNKEYQTKIEELKKQHKDVQSKANKIQEQITKLEDEYRKSLIDNLYSNFVGKYFKLTTDSNDIEYFYVRNITTDSYSDNLNFVCDRIILTGSRYIEMVISINEEFAYIEPEELVEVTKEEFMSTYDNVCKKMLSNGLGETNKC